MNIDWSQLITIEDKFSQKKEAKKAEKDKQNASEKANLEKEVKSCFFTSSQDIMAAF